MRTQRVIELVRSNILPFRINGVKFLKQKNTQFALGWVGWSVFNPLPNTTGSTFLCVTSSSHIK